MQPMNNLELKYYLKDLERRALKYEAATAPRSPSALGTRIGELWLAIRSLRISKPMAMPRSDTQSVQGGALKPGV
jgi:hypothetical protein